MRRGHLTGGAVVAALVVGGLVADGGRAQQQQQPRTIELTARHDGGFRVDNRPRGASPGDLLGFRETLLIGGRRVGSGHGTCVAISRTLSDCSVTAALAEGTIVGRFTQNFSKRTVTVAVIGGTGAYRAARGEASVRFGERANRLVFRLVD